VSIQSQLACFLFLIVCQQPFNKRLAKRFCSQGFFSEEKKAFALKEWGDKKNEKRY